MIDVAEHGLEDVFTDTCPSSCRKACKLSFYHGDYVDPFPEAVPKFLSRFTVTDCRIYCPWRFF